MRSLLLFSVLIAATLSLTSSTAGRPVDLSPSATEVVQVIDVTAKKYEFNPSPIRVKQGTRVQLKITATDHAHGFRIRELPERADTTDTKGKGGLVFSSPQDCQKIEKGQTATVEFVAQTPGTYPFRCCTRCGWHHRAMKGQLIVEP
jgi:heme/copper-type cytochrome/quinol oxidase subunit 2